MYVRRVDLSTVDFTLSSHRHPYVSLLLGLALSLNKKNKPIINTTSRKTWTHRISRGLIFSFEEETTASQGTVDSERASNKTSRELEAAQMKSFKTDNLAKKARKDKEEKERELK